MALLSVNVNKIATLRNARTPPGEGAEQHGVPSVTRSVRICVAAGVPSITVHPREDLRHITPTDVRDIARELAPHRGRAPSQRRVELNIEGDPRPDLLGLVDEIRPDQLTLVPVLPGEVTSQAGWPATTPASTLSGIIERAHAIGARVSLFVDPAPEPIRWAASLGADRIELYTEPYARAFEAGGAARDDALALYAESAALATQLGLGINAGHDLDLANLGPFAARVAGLDEVSIGHALVAEAVFDGLDAVVRRYLDVLAGAGSDASVSDVG